MAYIHFLLQLFSILSVLMKLPHPAHSTVRRSPNLQWIALLLMPFAVLHGQNISAPLLIEEGEEEANPPTLEQQVNDFSGNPLLRPSRHVGNFESLIVQFKMDGIDGQHLALRGPALSLKGSVPRDWQEDPTLTGRYSIALRNRYAPDLLMTFTVFRKSAFALSYERNDLIAFLAGLRQQYSHRLKLNDMPTDFRDSGFNAHLLGGETVHFDYSIEPREQQGPTIRNRIYWVLIEDHWVEIALIGPVAQVAPAIPAFERFLRNLSVVQNEAEAFGE